MKQIWSELYQKTQKLKAPRHIPNVLNKEQVAHLLRLLTEVWQEFSKHKNRGKGLKVYIEQELNHAAMQSMVDLPPLEKESLENWTKRVFEDKKFGAIINELEEYSNSITAYLAQIVQPLFRESGFPVLGVSWLSFMGNYGYTPFGIHRESKGEEGFLFHLGPEKKTFYIWELEDYNNITGGAEVSPINDELLAKAQAHELSPGDVFFIPFQTYHIAYTGEFSASIVMDFINPPLMRLMDNLNSTLFNYHPRQSYINPFNDNTDLTVNTVLEGLKDDQLVRQRIQHQLMLIQSNAGIGKPSLVKADINVNPDEKYKLRSPFMILEDKLPDEGKVRLYARGHIQTFNDHPRLDNIITKWNDKEAFSLEGLKNIFQPEWDEMDVMALYYFLLSIDVLTLAND